MFAGRIIFAVKNLYFCKTGNHLNGDINTMISGLYEGFSLNDEYHLHVCVFAVIMQKQAFRMHSHGSQICARHTAILYDPQKKGKEKVAELSEKSFLYDFINTCRFYVLYILIIIIIITMWVRSECICELVPYSSNNQ